MTRPEPIAVSCSTDESGRAWARIRFPRPRTRDGRARSAAPRAPAGRSRGGGSWRAPAGWRFPAAPPPRPQYDQGREQVMAFFGGQVFRAFPLAGFAIRLALQHAVLDERGESLAEQGPRAADIGQEMLEAARPVKRLS